ncbi:MAG TPA: ATP-binding protein [Chitinophagales bacterium]|nr:ATP-binding protein [Chitinophagales bacterium]
MGTKKKEMPPHFRTHVHIKNIIGSELINNDNIAILELVKNSFDAGAKKVEITFKNLKINDDKHVDLYSDKTSKIIIMDRGVGMNEDDILNKWLNIAYSAKKQKGEEFGRVMAGNKGIGRFSCDRLGSYLDIFSRKNGDSKFVHLNVDWTKFDQSDEKAEIQNIPVTVEKITEHQLETRFQVKPFAQGTYIEISKLRSEWVTLKESKKKANNKKAIKLEWDAKHLSDLKHYLEKLINPNQVIGEENTFQIELKVPELRQEDKKNEEEDKLDLVINGPIQNKIFTSLSFKTTSIEVTIEVKNGMKILKTVLKDKGNDIYELEENIQENPDYNKIDSAFLVIYFLNPYAKQHFKRQTGMHSVNFGSIHLFKNGFRISPYGDEGDDWLGLEKRKGQGTRRFLGTRDIVGRIELKDHSNSFKEVTSREGLVQNDAFRVLKDTFYYTAHKRLEKFVVEGLHWDSIPTEALKEINKKTDNPDFADNLFKMSQEQKSAYALDAIRSLVKPGDKNVLHLKIHPEVIYSLAGEERAKFEEVYQDFEKFGGNKLDPNIEKSLVQVKSLLEKKEEEIRILKEQQVIVDTEGLFSKPTQEDSKEIQEIQHHINQATGRILRALGLLFEGVENNSPKEDIFKIIDLVSFETKKIATVSRFVTQAKFNLLSSEVTEDIVKFIFEYIENVYKNYSDLKINKQVLTPFLFKKGDVELIRNFRPIDMIFILDNLFDNSFKAGAKKVEITLVNLSPKILEMRIKDDGKGLDKAIKNVNDIFNYGFTTTQNMGGTGIGLYHVKNIIQKMNGTIEINSDNHIGLEFIIHLKK